MKKLLALLLALAMIFALTACGTTTENTETPDTTESKAPTTETTETTGTPETTEVTDVPSYTITYATSALSNNWNPHTWETSADSNVMSYINMGFVDMSIDDSENGVYQWIYEMADKINDVTADHQDDLVKYNCILPEGKEATDIEEGYVFEFKLNQNAKWQNGEAINADTYVYSMQQLLNPEMHNYRANLYIAGESALAGAEAYYYSGSTSNLDTKGAYAMADLTANEDGQYVTAEGYPVYIGLNFALAQTGGDTLKDYVDAYGDQYFDVTNWETLVGMMDENGLIPLTDENYELFVPVTTGNENWGETEDDVPNYFVYAKTFPEVSFDTVGLYKVDDYTFIYVCQTAIDFNYFLTSCTDNWIVYKEYYEAGKDSSGDLVTTNYHSSVENTMAYGPYMLESMQTDKQMVFVQNPNWYGWEQGEDGTLVSYTNFDVDGEKVQQFRATRIVYNVMDPTAEKQAFLKGELSTWSPTAEELVTYASSDQLYKSDETYTQSFFFNTGIDALKAMDESKGNTNSVVLSNVNFRKAFSLSIDRAKYVTVTAGFKPAYSLLNSLYHYDIYNDPASSYRNTDQAKKAIVNLYGVEYGEGKAYATLDEAYKSINGYNLSEAKELMKTACEELVADGLYTEGEPINIRIAYKKGALDTTDNNQVVMMNEFINAAAEGSGFGTITFEAIGNLEDRYGAVPAGEYAIGYGAWGGAAFYPFRNMRVYCDPDYVSIHEAGCWDPATETLTINLNGEDVTMTWKDWSNASTGTGAYANADFETKLDILSAMEEAYLAKYYRIPLAGTTACTMLSFQLQFYTEDYNIMYGFGGERLLRFNYTDAEWADFVASQNGELHYE